VITGGVNHAMEQRAGVDDVALGRLAAWIGGGVAIREVERLSGGAIQENWGLRIARADGSEERLVLRRDAAATIASSRSRAEEFRVLEVAEAAGIRVAAPVALCTDELVLGGPFFLMQRVEGVADPRRLVREDALVGDRASFGAALGAELARIHAIRPPRRELGFLGEAEADPAMARIRAHRESLARLAAPQPAIEYVLRRLERSRKRPAAITLVHGDYRIGNVMVEEGRIAAVLDWEFADWGDPDEDLGWFTARCWRFGREDLEAGGVADRADFYSGYERVSGRKVALETAPYWEAMAAIRWAIIALQQGERHRGEEKPGLEAALSGRMAPQLVQEAMTVMRAIGDA
jgi:aminoglycoside phosphotransferase (APT) family kinase protein